MMNQRTIRTGRLCGFSVDRLARDIGFGHDVHVMHFLQLPTVPRSGDGSRSRCEAIAASLSPMPRRMNSQSCRSRSAALP